MTLTQRMDMAWHLWRTTGQACYQEEYLALADLAAMIQSRSPHYLRALADGLAIVRCGEGLDEPGTGREEEHAMTTTGPCALCGMDRRTNAQSLCHDCDRASVETPEYYCAHCGSTEDLTPYRLSWYCPGCAPHEAQPGP